jgi:hypothetical protein
VPPEASAIDRELALLEAELKRLEAEYNMFFSGRLPRPPWETRARVQAIVKRVDRTPIGNYGQKFRFTTLQTRFSRFTDLWDRALKAREEGRPGPFSLPRRAPEPEPEHRVAADRILNVTTFRDPLTETEKLRDLYDSLAEARREVGQDAVPFHRFAELIKTQVSNLQARGSPEVAFRIAIQDGKVNVTARALKVPPVK